jgi:hypothetical protein
MKKYTPEQEEEIKARYILNPTTETVMALALQYDVPIRSIIAKLSHFNIYQAKRYVSKTGMPPIKKAELVQQLSPIFKDFELEQLEKLSKPLIIKLINRLVNPCNEIVSRID